MHKRLVLLALFLLSGFAGVGQGAEFRSDEPERSRDRIAAFQAVRSYEEALQTWKTPEDVHGWIATNFAYDMARAMQLSETRKAEQARPIYTPAEFFQGKTGMCVDLSRFAVETLRRIDPQSDPKYLMIVFDPIRIDGNTLRLHWLVSFRRGGGIRFFADSKRPGHIAGPYRNVSEFVADYQRYRGRKIVDFRELTSYEKQKGKKALKRPAMKKP